MWVAVSPLKIARVFKAISVFHLAEELDAGVSCCRAALLPEVCLAICALDSKWVAAVYIVKRCWLHHLDLLVKDLNAILIISLELDDT